MRQAKVNLLLVRWLVSYLVSLVEEEEEEATTTSTFFKATQHTQTQTKNLFSFPMRQLVTSVPSIVCLSTSIEYNFSVNLAACLLLVLPLY